MSHAVYSYLPNTLPAAGTPTSAPIDTGAGGTVAKPDASLETQKVQKKKALTTEEATFSATAPAPYAPLQTFTASDAPPLPPVEGPFTSARDTQGPVVAWLSHPFMSLAQATDVLSDVAADTMMQYGKLKNIVDNDEYTAQKASAAAQVEEVRGERKSARNKLVGACVAVTAAGIFGGAGGYMSYSAGKALRAGQGAALSGMAMGVSQLINSTTDYIDTCSTFGGQYQADQAKIKKSTEDMYATAYKNSSDTMNTEYENSRKAVQNVWDMLRNIADKNDQVVMSIMQNV